MEEFSKKIKNDILDIDIQGANIDKVIEIMNKTKYVYSLHTNTISFHKANDKNVKEYYYTRVADGKKITALTKAQLIEKLYNYYEGGKDYTFRSIFNEAEEYRLLNGIVKDITIRDDKLRYNAFIDEELSNKDIRQIDENYIHKYILSKVKSLNMTMRDVKRYKGILNIVFQYSLEDGRQYIIRNPVKKNNSIYYKFCRVDNIKIVDNIFSLNDIDCIKQELDNRINNKSYDLYAYIIKIAILTGMREGELISLKWEDIKTNYIHIHSQQNVSYNNKRKTYYYNESTKNEKGVSKGGRKFPLTEEIKETLQALKEKQELLQIKSIWVFAKRDGNWTNVDNYSCVLRRLCKHLNLNCTNNHAFRKALNSYVLIPKGINVNDRAKLLGHSPEVNFKHYTIAQGDDKLTELAQILDN